MEQSSTDGIIPWLLAGVGTVIGILSSTVAYLFRLRENENAKAIEELRKQNEIINSKADKCETDRAALHTRCEVLQVKVEALEKRVQHIDIDGTKYSQQFRDHFQ